MTSERRIITRAFFASALVHAVVALLTWNLDLFSESAGSSARAAEDEIELFLVPEESMIPNKEQPSTYTAIPERLAAEKPPEHADFLALHNARAADLRPGEEDLAEPAAERESEVTQVAIQQESLAGAGGVSFLPEQQIQSQPSGERGRESRAEPGDQARETGRQGQLPLAAAEDRRGAADSDVFEDTEGREGVQPTPVPDWLAGGAPSILREGEQSSEGDRGFDFDHMAQGKVDGNVIINGAFSLNTYEWNWAPWMHRFEQDLYRNWIAPYAYRRLGVIDGKTQIRLVVERSGHASSMDVLQTEGHESLHQASVAALQAFAPYAPLPAGFPEENLVIILTLHYPAWKTLVQPQRSRPQTPARRSR